MVPLRRGKTSGKKDINDNRWHSHSKLYGVFEQGTQPGDSPPSTR